MTGSATHSPPGPATPSDIGLSSKFRGMCGGSLRQPRAATSLSQPGRSGQRSKRGQRVGALSLPPCCRSLRGSGSKAFLEARPPAPPAVHPAPLLVRSMLVSNPNYSVAAADWEAKQRN